MDIDFKIKRKVVLQRHLTLKKEEPRVKFVCIYVNEWSVSVLTVEQVFFTIARIRRCKRVWLIRNKNLSEF